jgi:TatD DNase family protein
MFVDSHCHLEGPKFAQDRGEVLFRAQEAGLEALVAIGNGNGPEDMDCGIRLADGHDWMWATAGVHPHEARLADEEAFQVLDGLAQHPKVIAVGEIGLDYHYDHSPREVQREVLVRQMEIARARKKPVVIHNRTSDNSENAWIDLLHLLDEHWASTGLGGVLHCFTGEVKHAHAALDMGFMISFAGNVTYPKAQNIRAAAKAIPLDRMLIETDSPYLAPVPYRGKRNEPAYVVETARQIAELRGITRDEVGRATTDNFYRFFKLR